MGSVKRPRSSRKTDNDSALGAYVSRHRDAADDLSVSSRQRVRAKMQSDIDAYIQAGGTIHQFDITMTAEKMSRR